MKSTACMATWTPPAAESRRPRNLPSSRNPDALARPVSGGKESVSDAADNFAADLTRRLAAGSADAVELFYRRYFDFLLAHARRATGRDEAFCLDVVQEVVLKIIRLTRVVKSESQWNAWLKLVVRTTAYDLLKSEQRRTARQIAVIVPQQYETPECDERIEILHAEIARLDPQLARMIEMRFTGGWTLSRIGKAFGLSIGGVDGRLRRALANLRTRIEEASHD